MTARFAKKIGTGAAIVALTFTSNGFASSDIPSDIKTVESATPPYVAKVSGNRLISIVLPPTLRPRDMNAENAIRSETNDFKPARYYFPNVVVPEKIVRDLDKIYLYDRRRDVPIV